MKSFKELLSSRRFLPLFATQFLGAFNDNIYKNALVILLTYVLAERLGLNSQLMITLAAGAFILPFFLFSATAGKMADAHEKASLIRWIKLAEIFLMLLGALGFWLENLWILMSILVGLGVQSAFFGPLKYAILPDHLEKEELLAGNALIEAGTFLAILLGTILGGVLILESFGPAAVIALTLLFAVGGFLSSFYIPKAGPAEPGLSVGFHILRDTKDMMGIAKYDDVLFLTIMGISWFWFIGAMFLAQFPTIVSGLIGGNEHIVTLFLTLFSVGIAAGSILCQRLLKGKIDTSWVPVGIIGISVFMVDLVFALRGPTPEGGELIGLGTYMLSWNHWRIMFDLFSISLCGGMYVVPLYAKMQHQSPSAIRSRVIASNNIYNSLFMVISALITMVLFTLRYDVLDVLILTAMLNGLVALYVCRLLPEIVIKQLLKAILKPLYRVRVKGLSHFHEAGENVVILPNHTSMLDALFIAVFLPTKLTFTIHNQQAKRWWIHWVLKLVKAFVLDPANPMSLKALIETMRKETMRVVIFPEGRITTTGSLMKMYEGPAMIADKTGARLLPVYIEGAMYTPFTRVKGMVLSRWFPKITITIHPPQTIQIDPNLFGRKRRKHLNMLLYRLMKESMFASLNHRQHLFEALREAVGHFGRNHVVLEDIRRVPLTYHSLIMRTHILESLLEPRLKQEKHVGVMLPSTAASVVLLFALLHMRRIPAMLNMAAGRAAFESACKTAQLKIIVTSREFVEKARLEWIVDLSREMGILMVYLEDLREGMPFYQPLLSFMAAHRICMASYESPLKSVSPDDPAVILFTSGSEGVPKGVVLSHANLLANAQQLRCAVDFSPKDVVFNALPLFHAFGLSSATLLPIISGVKVFLYPSPLHFRIIPEMVYDTGATILFGTDTFLSGYGRFAHPYDFHSLRYIFSGAEKLKPHTFDHFVQNFGIRILEGYGATECSPVVAVSSAMHQKIQSVGALVPGLDYKIEPVADINNGGELWVRGPNVMLGYMKHDQPGDIQPLQEGWYDTGDIVTMDESGFVSIVGRKKRFAKIGGEMVSLTSVEEAMSAIWPDYHHAVLAVEDAKKGEKIIVITDCKRADKATLHAYLKEHGCSELAYPKLVEYRRQIPLLATGKINYPELEKEIE